MFGKTSSDDGCDCCRDMRIDYNLRKIANASARQLNDLKPSDSATPKSDDKSPTPTDTNTSFKEELEKILERFMYSYTHLDDPYDLKQALTSIINLVDKELPKEKMLPSEHGDYPLKNASEDYCLGFNQAIANMRAIIRKS